MVRARYHLALPDYRIPSRFFRFFALLLHHGVITTHGVTPVATSLSLLASFLVAKAAHDHLASCAQADLRSFPSVTTVMP